MTLDYNDSRIKIKTGVWDKDKIDIYNNEYYGYSSYYSNNRYYIEDDDGNDNDLNDDEENIKVKVRIRIKVIIRLKLKVKQKYIIEFIDVSDELINIIMVLISII